MAVVALIVAIALIVSGSKDNRIGSNPGSAVADVQEITVKTRTKWVVVSYSTNDATVHFTTEDNRSIRANMDLDDEDVEKFKDEGELLLPVHYNRDDPTEVSKPGDHSTSGGIKYVGAGLLIVLTLMFGALTFINTKKYGWKAPQD